MSEATEKQISFATSLGIENPSQYSKETLKELISAKTGGDKPKSTSQNTSNAVLGTTQGIAKVDHNFQSEYEFGPAGNRHKIKYRTIEELKQRIKELENEGYFVEKEKI